MARLTTQQRQRLPIGDFATPPTAAAKAKGAKGSYPVPDAAHARNALARVAQHGSPAQKAAVRAKVKAKFPGIGGGGKKPRPRGAALAKKLNAS